MWPWKKKSPAADGLEMVVNGQCSDGGAAVTGMAVAGGAAAAVPAPATDRAAVEVAKPPLTVVVEKVYEHLIVFDLTGQRPFVKNADPDELADEIARLEVEPAFADNAFIANILAQRVDCENLYENVGVGALLARHEFGLRLPDVHSVGLPDEQMQFVDEEEGQLLDADVGGDVAIAAPASPRARADYGEDVDDDSTICFRCSVPKNKCSIL